MITKAVENALPLCSKHYREVIHAMVLVIECFLCGKLIMSSSYNKANDLMLVDLTFRQSDLLLFDKRTFMSESDAATDAGLERINTRYERQAASYAGTPDRDVIRTYCKALTIVHVAKHCIARKRSYWQMPLIIALTH